MLVDFRGFGPGDEFRFAEVEVVILLRVRDYRFLGRRLRASGVIIPEAIALKVFARAAFRIVCVFMILFGRG